MNYRCAVCKQSTRRTWTLERGPEDEQDDRRDYEEITVCETCLVDSMLDGIKGR